MPSSIKHYADPMKALEYRNHQRKQNYQKTQKYNRREWTEEEITLIHSHTVSDRELSSILHRSVQSIQMKRHKTKEL